MIIKQIHLVQLASTIENFRQTLWTVQTINCIKRDFLFLTGWMSKGYA